MGINVTMVNEIPPILSNGQVNPTNGYNDSTAFVFSVNYTDLENNAPTYVNITLNSTVYSMIKQNSMDNDYRDGCIYVISTTLSAGIYNFHFNCSDGIYFSSDGPFSGPIVESISLWNETSLEGVRIGTVITHGEDNPRTTYPNLVTELVQRGATITDINTEINLDLLLNYDLIWFDEYGSSMLNSEIDAIETWVSNGGRFLITGDNMGSAIGLAGRFNISYGGFVSGGTTTDILDHSITLGVNSVYFPSPSSRLIISAQPLANVCVRLNTYNLVVAMEYGVGAFVIIVDENVLTSYSSADNHILINNTFGWLGHIINNNNNEPYLSDSSIKPPSGNQTTEFIFSVRYTDEDNNPPQLILVRINGTPYTLEKQNGGDNDYTDGCIYQFRTYLTPGIYNYSFECHDGRYSNSTNTYLLVVNKVNTEHPHLLNPVVTPQQGGNSTLFNFTVWYFDIDNDSPVFINITIDTIVYPMIAVNSYDINFTDGALYSYSTILEYGVYQFRVNCSDGGLYNWTEWIFAPQVTPFCDFPAIISILNPLNGSIEAPGVIGFVWQSIEFPLGPLNYTLQLSNTPDFSYILIEENEIRETPTVTALVIHISLSPGQYYWRVCPNYGEFVGNWSNTNILIMKKGITPPGFFERNWVWFLLIGTSAAAAISVVVIARKKSPKKTELNLKTKFLEPISSDFDKEAGILMPLSEEVQKGEQEILGENTEGPLFYCSKCGRYTQIINPDNTVRYSCTTCQELLLRIVRCPHCKEPISLIQEEYSASLGKIIICPSCTESFTLSEQLKAQIQSHEEKEEVEEANKLSLSFMEIDKEHFWCRECQKEYLIENPNLSKNYICQVCNKPLERTIKCSSCGYTIKFNQEEVRTFMRDNIRCPECKKKQEEAEIKKITLKLYKDDKEIRLQAAELLGEIGNQIAGPSLIGVALTDQDEDVRSMAISSLGMIGLKSALPILRRIKEEDKETKVRDHAAKIIEWLERKDK